MSGVRQVKRGMIIAGTRSDDGTVVTIPANSMFNGEAFLSGSMAAAGLGEPSITVRGTDCDPVNDTVIHQLSIAGLEGAVATESCALQILIKTGAAPATLLFSISGASSASATVNGFLV